MSIENLLALNSLIKQFTTENTEKHTPLCIKCKAELALVAACQCYEGNHIICDCCGKPVKGDIEIYHCEKSGYDLCVPCSYHHQHQTDERMPHTFAICIVLQYITTHLHKETQQQLKH
eukprot:880165_1